MTLFKGNFEGLKGVLGILIVATALAGCDGSSTDAGSSATSAAAGTSSVGPVVNRSLGRITLSSSSYNAAPASSAVITITRSGSGSGATTVGYTTVNGSAVAGVDYTANTGNLSWQDGDTNAKTIVVPVTSSANGKVFAISLTSIQGHDGFGNPASATVQVTTAAANASTGSSTSSGGGSTSSSSGTTTSSGGSSSGGVTSSTSSSSGVTSSTSSSSGVTSSTSSSSGVTSSSSSSSSSGATTANKSATLNWSAPTDNTDGSALTNLTGYNIYYGTSTGAMTNKISINTVGMLTYVIDNMNSGNWYFAITAVNASGVESVLSNTVQVTL